MNDISSYAAKVRNSCSSKQLLLSLFDLLEDREDSAILGWVEEGKKFKIYDSMRFEELVLPRLPHCAEISDFIRKLKALKFNCFEEALIFYHPYYRSKSKYLIPKIFEKKVSPALRELKEKTKENCMLKELSEALSLELYQEIQNIKRLRKENLQLRMIIEFLDECENQPIEVQIQPNPMN